MKLLKAMLQALATIGAVALFIACILYLPKEVLGCIMGLFIFAALTANFYFSNLVE